MADAAGFAGGVLTAFLAQSVVQLYVVPRAEQRKRREQRWEQNVIELADLLAGDLTRLAGEAASEVRVYVAVVGSMDERERAEKDSVLRDWASVAREKQRAYDAMVRGRLELLLDRVVAFSPDAEQLTAVRRHAAIFRLRALGTSRYQYELDEADADEVDQAWDAEAMAREGLISEAARLSAGRRPPRPGAARALRLRVKRSRPVAAVGRGRARRQAARDQQGAAGAQSGARHQDA